jgi:hypothetical protein
MVLCELAAKDPTDPPKVDPDYLINDVELYWFCELSVFE